MSWVTIISPMVAPVCFTLAAVHLLAWCKRRPAWETPALPLATAICCLVAIESRASHPTFRTDPTYLIDTWETADGLPENSATAMVQTPDGYLWFGTFNGLVRFDGVKFTVFDPANTPQLPSGSIVNLHCDRSARFWVSTTSGLALREGGQWRALGTNDGWPQDAIRTFSERGNGDLLLTTFNGRVFEWAKGRLTELPPPPGQPGKGYAGCVDEAGQWWVAQHQFIGLWDGQRWISKIVPIKARADRIACNPARDGGFWLLMERELRKYRGGIEVSRVVLSEATGGVWRLSEDHRGNVWICSYDRGVCQVLPDGRMHRWTTTNGLGSVSARFVSEDRENNLWVGTSGGGLARFKPRRFQSFGVENGLTERAVNSLWPDRDGGMWVATQGQGLFHLREGRATNVPLPVTDITIYAQSVISDHAGRLWLGTSRNLWQSEKKDFRKVQPEQLHDADIPALFEDSQGRIWIGGAKRAAVLERDNLRVFGAADGLPAEGARCFAEDSGGTIWLSTHQGVFRWATNQFVELRDRGGRLRNITCFKADADGTLWLGSLDQGLLCQREERLARIEPAAGLPRSVLGILEDATGYFWLASNRGVVRVRAQDLRLAAAGKVSLLDCQQLDLSDGLPSAECTSGQQPSCARDANGNLWLAPLKGAAMIHPADFRVNTNSPPVQIEELIYRLPDHANVPRDGSASPPPMETVVRLAAPFPEPLRLPPGSRQIEIHYTALHFSAPEKVRFQTRLNGPSDSWDQPQARRVVPYAQLPPGDYAFRVRAANNDGVWNETGASLAFTVLPFFWQTAWFRLVGALLLIGSGGSAVWWLVRARLRRAEFKKAVLDSVAAHIAVLDHNGVIIAVNARWQQFARENSEVTGEPAANTDVGVNYLKVCRQGISGSTEAAQAAHDGILAVIAGKLPTYTLEYRCDSPQRQRWFSMSATPMGPEGKSVIVAHVDITDRRQAEMELHAQRDELAHLSRVTTMSELSGSLAHELNQPLAIILTNAQAAQRLLAQSPPDLAEACDILADIVSEDQRAGEVIRRLRSLLKPGESHFQPLSVNETIEEVLHIARSDLIARGIIVHRALARNTPPVLADRIQLQQVLLNLILNACHAMTANPPGGQQLTLTTKPQDGKVRISVSDTGCGLPPDANRIFEPFYTTKNQGLGLGLPICRSIVTAHKGRLWAEANVAAGVSPTTTPSSHGATFHVELPAAEEAKS